MKNPFTKQFKHIFFCDYTQTYRLYPQNYWLASIKENKLIFDSWDGAIKSFKFKSDVISLHDQIFKLKKENSKLKPTNNLIPVIIKSNLFDVLEIQFWTERQIYNKKLKNSDNSYSYFVSKL